MENEKHEVVEKIKEMLREESLGVLATCGENCAPHASLLGFVSKGIEEIYFASLAHTRKVRNIVENPSVSLLIDSRRSTGADFRSAAALTVRGIAEPVKKGGNVKKTYLEKFPHLRDFIEDPGCTMFKIRISEHLLVRRFQEVRSLVLK